MSPRAKIDGSGSQEGQLAWLSRMASGNLRLRSQRSKWSIVAALSILAVVAYASFQQGVTDRRQLTVIERLDEAEYANQQLELAIQEQKEALVAAGVPALRTAMAPQVRIVEAGSRPEPTRAPDPTPKPGPLEPVLGPAAKGFISITVDRLEAAPGDTLRYTITLRNLERTEQRFAVTSHVPVQTRFARSSECSTGNLIESGDGVATCFAGAPGRSGQHQVYYERRLNPKQSDEFWFEVVVSVDARNGSVVTNHAHAQGPQIQLQTSNETRTRVKEEPAPT